mgnify:CR=1 FL=1
MLTTTLSFANLHNYGELFANMLRARRELFIVHNKWNLPEAMGMEYDQYDTPASRWVVVHDAEGKVLAGNRLTPTTTRCGSSIFTRSAMALPRIWPPRLRR